MHDGAPPGPGSWEQNEAAVQTIIYSQLKSYAYSLQNYMYCIFSLFEGEMCNFLVPLNSNAKIMTHFLQREL